MGGAHLGFGLCALVQCFTTDHRLGRGGGSIGCARLGNDGGDGFAGRGSDPEFHPCLYTGFGRDCNGIGSTSSGAALAAV